MTRRVDCQHEADVFEAVATNRWPARVDAELKAHVASCAICSDVVVVVSAFEDESAAARMEAPQLPGSGLVWWRAQMRARQEAARAAVRPITVAQAVAFAGAVGVAGAVFGATVSWFQRGLGWFSGEMKSLWSVRLPEPPAGLVTLLTEHPELIALALVAAVLVPLGIYLAVRWSERPAQ